MRFLGLGICVEILSKAKECEFNSTHVCSVNARDLETWLESRRGRQKRDTVYR